MDSVSGPLFGLVFWVVERAALHHRRKLLQLVLHQERAALEIKLDQCYQPIVGWYNMNQMKLYRPLQETVTWIHDDQASSVTATAMPDLS